MFILLAIDDKGGMLFNGRRQSQDRVLRERILEITKGSILWMNQYSFKQFVSMGTTSNITVADDFLDRASFGEYCFVENVSTGSYYKKIEKIFLFKWNRVYPRDFYFDIDLSKNNWLLEKTEEFTGSSHEKITLEVYKNEND